MTMIFIPRVTNAFDGDNMDRVNNFAGVDPRERINA